MNENNVGNIESDIARLTEKVDNLMSKIDDLSSLVNPKLEKLSKIETDTDWLKRFFWIMASGVIASLIGSLINLVKR